MSEKAIAWLKLARFQFHPMAFIAYSVGVAAAYHATGVFNGAVYGVGYVVLFLIELATIFSNEIYDYETDRLNSNYGPFTGGSRMLVEGRITAAQARVGVVIALLLCGGAAALLVGIERAASPVAVLSSIAVGVVLGIGYTVPPLRFSYRGLGEVVVGSTHSFYLIVCGYLFQTGVWQSDLPWLLGIPLFFSVVAANTLAGIPDRPSDAMASKKSISVLLGSRHATTVAGVCVVLAALSGFALWLRGIIPGLTGAAILIVVPHAVLLLAALRTLRRKGEFDRRIDPLMASTLTYILWFGIIPLGALLW
ncbi:MAG: prenyltransferase [Chloroflexota bacterium]